MTHLAARALAGLVVLSMLAAGPAGAADDPSATLAVEPAGVGFGDAFLLRAEVRIPGGQAEAAAVVDTAPLVALAPATSTRRTDGDATVITVTQRVACLSSACLSAGRTRVVRAGAVSVRTGGRTVAVAATPAVVAVRGRVDPALARRPSAGYRTDTSVPAQTFPIAPGTLVALLVAVAAIAVLAALGLLVPDARRRLAGRTGAVETDPFARALRLLRESAVRAAADRRRAADLVARLVGTRDGPERRHGEAAARVAWSRPEPAPADAVGLADAVERDRLREAP